MKPGWGERHPAVTGLIRQHSSIATDTTVFGVDPMRVTGYFDDVAPPDDLVLSVRCCILVDGKLVVCTTTHGSRHPWPGGRREAGESFLETGFREVHEETGWWLDRDSMRHIGWLHFEQLSPRRFVEYPYPDFFQIVYRCEATSRDGDGDWTDTEGHETSSELLSLRDACAVFAGEPVALAFLELLAR